MLALINDHRSLLADHDFSFVATSPMLYHCHHYNLFFDQTIDDALGPERGIQVRTQAAYEASSQFLNAFISALPPTSPEERLDLANTVFSALGQGTLELDVSPTGGKAIGRNLHYGFAWREKYGSHIKRYHPADAVAAGYIAAAIEAAFGMPLGTVECRETSCMAMGGSRDHCAFEVTEADDSSAVFGVTRQDIAEAIPRSFKGLRDDEIAATASRLREFLAGVSGDSRGLMETFGNLLTFQMANYYNHCANRALDIITREKPAALEPAKDLLRESGHLCGFHTFGGILTSPEWDALFGPVRGEPIEIIDGCLAIARALGFGHWTLEAYEPQKTLILRSPATYESAYRKAAYEEEEGSFCHMYQGAALGMMQLAHRVPWQARPRLSNSMYLELRQDVPWKVQETHCVAAGNSVCRVVVG